MNDDIIQKLEKILALANNEGATEAEMQAAMAQAQKLAMRHNIDLATVSIGAQTQDPLIETDKIECDSKIADRRRPHHRPLAIALMECFQVKACWLDSGARIAFVGEKTDVALAAYCWHWLDAKFPKMYLAYIKSIGLIRTSADNDIRRRSYYEGVAYGIRQNNKREREALSKDDKNAYALVLVKKEDVVNARYEDEFPDARKARNSSRQTNHGAWNRGNADGKNIKLAHGLDAGNRAALT